MSSLSCNFSQSLKLYLVQRKRLVIWTAVCHIKKFEHHFIPVFFLSIALRFTTFASVIRFVKNRLDSPTLC